MVNQHARRSGRSTPVEGSNSRPATPTAIVPFGVDDLDPTFEHLTKGFSGKNQDFVKRFVSAINEELIIDYIDPKAKAQRLLEVGEYKHSTHPKKSDLRVDLQQDAEAAGGWNIACQVVNSTIATLWVPNGLKYCKAWIKEQLVEILEGDNPPGGRRYSKKA
ncbi:hypothetical protein CF327_g3137 [Tilletia walkeri]|uniref:Uncharacterized protein n=1 Tax=Tilletia walkeri TaxID=117179 RepID=A0A8X7NB50_9BASI|nr:hypothetical protein CF327_g3137 [Tilletia walkeri]KAE8268776.1 hypothetical protein A4X09_0g3555 [Tilletia walkeri]